MKTVLTMFLLQAGVLWALPPVETMLAASRHADTEISTNLPFAAEISRAGCLSLELEFAVSPSNAVEVAFGRAEGDALTLRETDLAVGWDCGAWFVREGMDALPLQATAASTGTVQTLVWRLRVDCEGRPRRLEASVDGTPVFVGIQLSRAFFSRDWNRIRLTGRGRDASGEAFRAVCRMDGTAFVFR